MSKISKPEKALIVLKKNVDEFARYIQSLIKEDRLEKACEELENFYRNVSDEVVDEANFSTASVKRIEKNYRMNLIDFAEYNRQRSKITKLLIDITNNLPKEIEAPVIESEISSNYFNSTEIEDDALEKIIGKNETVKIAWIHKALKASKSVCRVVRGDGGKGTGFLIDDGYLFTNNHVLSSIHHVKNSVIEFNYEEDEYGNPLPVTTYKLDSSDFQTDKKLDFTRVKILDPDNTLQQWGALKINPDYQPSIGEPVNIIQHPRGQYKQIALTANKVLSANWKYYLFYEADTEPGSSGSPIFNQDWEVIAIHHAGRLMSKGGLQIDEKGTRASANRGIYFKAINKIIDSGDAIISEANTEDTTEPISEPTKFFLLYDIADRDQVAKLTRHLSTLTRNNKMTVFDMHNIQGGGKINDLLEKNLRESKYVLICLTYNFMSSKYFNWFKKAEEMQVGTIPILINYVDIEGSGIDHYAGLPSNQIPVEGYDNEDKAYYDIATSLRNIL